MALNNHEYLDEHDSNYSMDDLIDYPSPPPPPPVLKPVKKLTQTTIRLSELDARKLDELVKYLTIKKGDAISKSISVGHFLLMEQLNGGEIYVKGLDGTMTRVQLL